jgi:cobalt/nickel transport system permease protein
MVGVHVVIGIGEALITMAALAFIATTRPDLLHLRPADGFGTLQPGEA